MQAFTFSPSTQSVFSSPEQVSAAVSPSSSFVNLGKGTKTKHILSSKQMAGRSREVWTERSKGFFLSSERLQEFLLSPDPRSFTHPATPAPLPEHALCSAAPLPLLSKLSAEVSGAHRSQGPREGKAPAAPRAFGFFRAGFAGAWSPMMPTLILGLDSVASTASADPSRSPIQGAAPHLPRSWNAKSLRQMAGAGRARVEWQQPLLREEARESAWFSDWDKLVGRRAGAVHCAVGAEPGTPADRLLPPLQATPSPTLCARPDPLH